MSLRWTLQLKCTLFYYVLTKWTYHYFLLFSVRFWCCLLRLINIASLARKLIFGGYIERLWQFNNKLSDSSVNYVPVIPVINWYWIYEMDYDTICFGPCVSTLNAAGQMLRNVIGLWTFQDVPLPVMPYFLQKTSCAKMCYI